MTIFKRLIGWALDRLLLRRARRRWRGGRGPRGPGGGQFPDTRF